MTDLDAATLPRRLNLGCGWDKRDGYLNVDLQAFHEPDLVADVRDLHMLPDGHFEEIIAQDVLEHLTRADAPVALKEWARLLEDGGRLVLRLPDLLGLLRQLERATTREKLIELVQCLFGTQGYEGDYHLNGYTEALLRQELYLAGFAVETLTPKDEWMFDVVAVRTDVPPRPGPVIPPRIAAGLSAVDAALDAARSVENPEPASLAETRFRLLKALVLRLTRSTSARQAEHNRLMQRAVEELATVVRTFDKS